MYGRSLRWTFVRRSHDASLEVTSVQDWKCDALRVRYLVLKYAKPFTTHCSGGNDEQRPNQLYPSTTTTSCFVPSSHCTREKASCWSQFTLLLRLPGYVAVTDSCRSLGPISLTSHHQSHHCPHPHTTHLSQCRTPTSDHRRHAVEARHAVDGVALAAEHLEAARESMAPAQQAMPHYQRRSHLRIKASSVR